MLLLGLLIAFLANKLLNGASFDYIFSFFSVLLFTTLAACHREPFAALAADPDLQIKPVDSLRFSILAALQLYLSSGIMFVIALTSSLTRASWGSRHYGHMHHHHQSHYSGFGRGGSIGGSIGGGGGSIGGGGGSVGGGGGGSFTP